MTQPGASQDLIQEARQLLGSLSQGAMSIAAYDTAWIARLPQPDHPDQPAFPQALAWLREHQHADGSWGGAHEYYHDRIISTLAAVLSLTQWGSASADSERCARALRYIADKALDLERDSYETVGFELIIPTLLEQAQARGLELPYHCFVKYQQIRAKKLSRIPADMLYTRDNPTAYSFECMGSDLQRDLATHIQEENGSVGNSPAATAYFLLACGEEPRARQYIAQVMGHDGGGAMFSYPLEIFERAWVLYNLDLAGLLDPLRAEAQPHLEYLLSVWDDAQGVSFSRSYTPRDVDDTAITFKMLRRACQRSGDPRFCASLHFLQAYEEADHFRTFRFETDPSISSNIHLLDALTCCLDEPTVRPRVAKILRFLRGTQAGRTFWVDKWHASPYYVTAHAILAASACDPDLVQDALAWIISTQNTDGSWGRCGSPTVEETAYCLQALLCYDREVRTVPEQPIDRAAAYLRAHRGQQRTSPLWISKILFSPLNIIESAVISALAMYEQRRS